jgi:hypothetical protein
LKAKKRGTATSQNAKNRGIVAANCKNRGKVAAKKRKNRGFVAAKLSNIAILSR